MWARSQFPRRIPAETYQAYGLYTDRLTTLTAADYHDARSGIGLPQVYLLDPRPLVRLISAPELLTPPHHSGYNYAQFALFCWWG